MSRRSARSDASIDHPRLLATLSDCRRVLIETLTRAKAGGPLYPGCSMVVAAIDGLSTFLTGNPYFHHIQAEPSDGPMRRPEGARHDGG